MYICYNTPMVVQGHIQDGIVVPDTALSLPDGTHVTIVVPSEASAADRTMSVEQKTRYLDALAKIDGVPNENPGDDFSGADHDRALYGNGYP